MNTIATLMGSAFFFVITLSQLKAGTIDLPLYGFKIDALDASADSGPGTALIMFLPKTQGFAPNINVQIQPYTGSLKDYIALSKGQFDQLKWKVISENQSGDNEWIVEYAGPMNEGDMHFYARAVSKAGKMYLVTATAEESQWATVGDTLRKNVDSFKAE
jgi:hypothetical protein